MLSHICIRDLQVQDLHGLQQLLRNLTHVDALPDERLACIHATRIARGILTKVAVDTQTGDVVGTASLLVEPKYTRGGRAVGHIEDVVVDARYRGHGICTALLHTLRKEADAANCYKLILDCSDELMPVYQRCGFVRAEAQMRLDLPSRL